MQGPNFRAGRCTHVCKSQIFVLSVAHMYVMLKPAGMPQNA
jgi:hypothetical protein